MASSNPMTAVLMCSSTFRRSSPFTDGTKVSFDAVMDPRKGKTNAQNVGLL
jgi:hypothetical protein